MDDAERPTLRFKLIRDRKNGSRYKLPLASLDALPDYAGALIDAMIHGVDHDYEVDGDLVPAGMPLTLKQAALACGVRCRQARELASTTLFKAELNKAEIGFRNSERPRNLHTAVVIRDDEGDGSAATKTARLKAIATIEGKPTAGTTINVNAQQNNAVAGYVIRLNRAPKKEPSDT